MTYITPYTLDHYLNEIASQHRYKHKFSAWCCELFQRAHNAQELIEEICDGFSLKNAIGVQLDALGEKIGVLRTLNIPLNIRYFELNDDSLHTWDDSVWHGRKVTRHLVTLDDQYYKIVLQIQSLKNRWDGTKAFALETYRQVFVNNPLTKNITITLKDNFDMTIDYIINGVTDSIIAGLFITGQLLFIPMGVSHTVTVMGYS